MDSERTPRRLRVAASCLVSCLSLAACATFGEEPRREGYQDRFGGHAAASPARAPAGSRVHAWRSGSLEGACLSRRVPHGSASPIVDISTLRESGLFAAGSATPGEPFERELALLAARIGAYTGLSSVALGVAARAPTEDAPAEALASARERALIERLSELLGDAVPVAPLASGARRLSADAADGARVEIRVEARGVRTDNRDPTVCRPRTPAALDAVALAAAPPPFPVAAPIPASTVFRGAPTISAGDRVSVRVPADEDFDGVYEIGADGSIALPYLDAVAVQGLTVAEIEALIARRLVERRLFRSGLVDISVAVQEWASADVFVRGAVFAPGRRVINGLKTDLREFKNRERSGDFARERLLSRALIASGGVRPDADLENIAVIRGEATIRVDLAGIPTGRPVRDLPLVAGDEVVVPSLGRFQSDLSRPTQITPPGVRVFLSNMTVSSGRNVVSSVGSDADDLPYGTRMLQALVSANCAGGVQRANGTRRAVLVSENPMSGQIEVIERDIEELLRSPDRPDVNPFLLPGDAILCYDSGVTGVREIARTVSDVLAPFVSLHILFGD